MSVGAGAVTNEEEEEDEDTEQDALLTGVQQSALHPSLFQPQLQPHAHINNSDVDADVDVGLDLEAGVVVLDSATVPLFSPAAAVANWCR